MSEYWTEKISKNYKCENCGGEVVVVRAAPIVKGSVAIYRCIRCSNRGSVKDRLRQKPRLRGIVKR